jgi:hypothetical protein
MVFIILFYLKNKFDGLKYPPNENNLKHLVKVAFMSADFFSHAESFVLTSKLSWLRPIGDKLSLNNSPFV